MAQSVKCLTSVQVMISRPWDPAPGGAPCSAGSLLVPLPACAHAHVCALSLLNKKNPKKDISKANSKIEDINLPLIVIINVK